MPSVITNLCLRDGSCAEVCPVNCIVPGKPDEDWPHYYIDPNTCINCVACIMECPHGAIFSALDVPSNYVAKGGERLSMPAKTAGYTQEYTGFNNDGETVHLKYTRVLSEGEIIDLTPSIKRNSDFFQTGPGYKS